MTAPRVIAVVGGDEREQEIARLAAAEGALVRAHGFPVPPSGIPGVVVHDSAGSALAGARYALFPIPGIAADGSLFAPEAPAPIVPDAELLGLLAPGGHVILGAADAGLRAAAARTGVELHEYEHDRELMLERAPSVVEGALALAIARTRASLHASEVVVVGYGNVSAVLAGSLRALGAHVAVVARNPVQRAQAYAAGHRTLGLEALGDAAATALALFSAVPAPVVDRAVLARMRPGSLVMDLAAPPGGVDLEAARELGLEGVWARGMGRRAPLTVGASQWRGIRRILDGIERRTGGAGGRAEAAG